MSVSQDRLAIALDSVDVRERPDATLGLAFHTSRGTIEALFHPCPTPRTAVICVSGVAGGLDGPSGLFASLGEALLGHDIATLRADYRKKSILQECVLDVLVGIAFLSGLGVSEIVLVGHSFGGAVAIMASVVSPLVKAVVSMASQTYGTVQVGKLAPRPLLLVHGSVDEVLPPSCSEEIYRRASAPKDLVVLPGANHAFEDHAEELTQLISDWILQRFPTA